MDFRFPLKNPSGKMYNPAGSVGEDLLGCTGEGVERGVLAKFLQLLFFKSPKFFVLISIFILIFLIVSSSSPS